jgi:mannan polymerase II complex ANP1 subunit
MAKRMQFSVVGLPHYTIWHMYEPSVDDIKHMEVRDRFLLSVWEVGVNILQQMELARLAQEKEDKEKAEKAQKLKESFGDTTGQWEEDKSKLQNLALQEKKKEVANAAVAAKEKKAGAQAAAGKTEEKLVARDGKQDDGKT